MNVQGLSRVRQVLNSTRLNLIVLEQGMFLPKALYWGMASLYSDRRLVLTGGAQTPAGHIGARDNVSLQIQNIVEEGYKSLGERPVVIGECGLPMDMKCVFVFLGSQLLDLHLHLLSSYLLTSISYFIATSPHAARVRRSGPTTSNGKAG